MVPVETEFGRKRQIDQSSCNKDYSCLRGFCPSFVTVEGGELRQGISEAAPGEPAALFEVPPDPELMALDAPYSVLVTGIGGTGVVTVAQLLGMAAHLEGKGAGIIDMAGLSQKNGAVASHLKIAPHPDDIKSIRVAAGGADLVLGCDIMGTGSDATLNTLSSARTRLVVNAHETMPAMFTHDREYKFPGEQLKVAIEARAGPGNVAFIEATRLATSLMGNSIAANLFLLGFAFQKGLVPLLAGSIERAIELNGVAVEMNREAFLWGRRAAHDPDQVERLAGGSDARPGTGRAPPKLEALVARRAAFLSEYQDAALAQRYQALVGRAEQAEKRLGGRRKEIAKAVARNYFALLAIKDEYEVARLFSDGVFEKAVAAKFTGEYTIHFHLAPPLLARRDRVSGHPRKIRFGPWMMRAFRLLTRLKGLRGSWLDIFGYSAERRAERALVADYETVMGECLAGLTPANRAVVLELAALPENVRGYGHVKAAAMADYYDRQRELLARRKRPAGRQKAVA